MSQNNPHRRPPPNTDLRPDLGSFSSSARRHASADHNFYRLRQDSYPSSFTSSHPSSSSTRGSAPVLQHHQSSQDGALSILNSCGLEPSDLSLLAEMPEDVLTVESLPHLLQQIKGKRGTVKPLPPPASPYPLRLMRDPPHIQPVQYPLDHLTTRPLPREQVQERLGRWGNPSQCSSLTSSSRQDPSSSYTAVPRPAATDYAGTRTLPFPTSLAAPADFRPVAPPEANQQRTQTGRRQPEASSSRSCSQLATDSAPTQKEMLDFYGTMPTVYPYLCSLCSVTALSERNWLKHIGGTHHADGQLQLLRRFPTWDCRMEKVIGIDNQSEKWRDGGNPLPQTASKITKAQPNKKAQKKVSDKSKVVCVKFPAQSVDEAFLRKLTEPFGKIVKILMFPSLAFVELGSVDQAKDLVKFHINYPPSVNGEQMEFSISNTFNFLQSSRVLSFTPAPTGEDSRADLISIVNRFGPPLYTLFLPSKVFVEMKTAPDAEKLVNYYSSNTLRINDNVIQVSLSGEYKSLMRVPSAERYEEETGSVQKMRSQSREMEDKTADSKRSCSKNTQNETRRKDRRSARSWSRETSRSRSRDEFGRRKTNRSWSIDKSSRDRKTRSRSREEPRKNRKTWSRSRETSSRERKTRSRSRETSSRERKTRSRSRETSSRERKTRSRSRETSSRERKTRSRSRETSSRERKTRSRSRDKFGRSRKHSLNCRDKCTSREETVLPDNPEATESWTDSEPVPIKDSKSVTEDEQLIAGGSDSSEEESDLEGMEVIGEDGKDLEDDDLETLEEAEIEMENEEEVEAAEGNHSPERGKDKEEEAETRTETPPGHEKEANPKKMPEFSVDGETDKRPSEPSCPYAFLPAETSLERRLKRNGSHEGDSGPEKVLQEDVTADTKDMQDDGHLCDPSPDQKSSEVQKLCSEAASQPGAVDPVPHGPSHQGDVPAGGDGKPEVGAAQLSKPVGTEFVRPVVGYFCHLCQVIYADEDEAKVQHCSSRSHYTKYQEKTRMNLS
ncbi:uncharacterized protein ACBR49_007398 [Aulostomus maculatus]